MTRNPPNEPGFRRPGQPGLSRPPVIGILVLIVAALIGGDMPALRSAVERGCRIPEHAALLRRLAP